MSDAPQNDDARFADGDPGLPLALRAETVDDLNILSALVQDAVINMTDIAHDPKGRRLSLLVTRVRWEDAEAAKGEGRPFERVRSVLSVSDALRVQSDSIDRNDADTVLSLLGLTWTPGDDGTGRLVLTFAGDGAIAVDAECLSVDLRDVTRPHVAVSGKLPTHD